MEPWRSFLDVYKHLKYEHARLRLKWLMMLVARYIHTLSICSFKKKISTASFIIDATISRTNFFHDLREHFRKHTFQYSTHHRINIKKHHIIKIFAPNETPQSNSMNQNIFALQKKFNEKVYFSSINYSMICSIN